MKSLKYKNWEGTAYYDSTDEMYYGNVVCELPAEQTEYCAATQQGLIIEFQKTVDRLKEQNLI